MSFFFGISTCLLKTTSVLFTSIGRIMREFLKYLSLKGGGCCNSNIVGR